LSKPSGRSNESPIEEREPAAELQCAIEDGAKKCAAAGDIGVYHSCDSGEEHAGEEEACRSGPEGVKFAPFTRDVPDRDGVAARSDHDKHECREGRPIDRLSTARLLHDGSTEYSLPKR